MVYGDAILRRPLVPPDSPQAPRPSSVAPTSAQRLPLLGLVSFLGLPVGAAAAHIATAANHGVTAGASTTGVSIGVLASAAVGLIATVGSRVRHTSTRVRVRYTKACASVR
jgi:hypothetical protein